MKKYLPSIGIKKIFLFGILGILLCSSIAAPFDVLYSGNSTAFAQSATPPTPAAPIPTSETSTPTTPSDTPAASPAETVTVAENPPTPTTQTDESEIEWGKLASMLVSIFTPLIAILAEFIGKLMGNEIIFGVYPGHDATANFEEILYIVWLIIRDLVNYMFIVVLLVISFMSVFGATTENNSFELKKLLPKFIIAVVAVNFTWFGARVVLDTAHVATQIVFAIPSTLIQAEQTSNPEACTQDPINEQISPIANEALAKENMEGDQSDQIKDPESVKTKIATALDASIKTVQESQRTDEQKEKMVEKIEAQKKRVESLDAQGLKGYLQGMRFPRVDTTTCFPGFVLTKNGSNGGIEQIALLKVDGTSVADLPGGGVYAEINRYVSTAENPRFVKDYGKFIIVWEDFNWARFQSNSIAALFAYNVMQVQNLPRSVRETLDGTVGIEDLVVNAGFALLFMVIIIIAFVVMAIVLFERVMVIWINIILSPLAALLFVLKDTGIGDGANLSEKGIGLQPFIKYAFLPALMALPLELGYILIMAGQSITVVGGGALGDRVGFETELINGVATIQQLLWYVIAVAVLWSSVSIAQDSSKFATSLIENVTNAAKSVGGFILKSPLYAQIIPTGVDTDNDKKEDAVDLMSLVRGFQNISVAREQKSRNTAQKIFGERDNSAKTRDSVSRLSPTQANDIMREINKRANAGEDLNTIFRSLSDDMKQAIGVTQEGDLKGAILALHERPDRRVQWEQSIKTLIPELNTSGTGSGGMDTAGKTQSGPQADAETPPKPTEDLNGDGVINEKDKPTQPPQDGA